MQVEGDVSLLIAVENINQALGPSFIYHKVEQVIVSHLDHYLLMRFGKLISSGDSFLLFGLVSNNVLIVLAENILVDKDFHVFD